jgi:short-subunit dehydrogenase
MTVGMELPEKLTAQPEEIAKAIYNAQRKHKNVIYSKWIWRWIMLLVTHLPNAIFKRLTL